MKVILCILDGVGITYGNGLSIPFVQNNLHNSVSLNASGKHVGLKEGQMGNSEVGHMTIGSGRIIKQYLSKIDDSIVSSTFPRITSDSSTYHLIALVSDGGVHSHMDHMIHLISELKGKKIWLHIITDGRDTPPRSAEKYIQKITPLLHENCQIGTISGRYYAMDRDNRSDRTELAYDAIALGKSSNQFESVMEFISKSYSDGTSDEFFVPTRNKNYGGFELEDTVVFCNFRSDRMKQIAELISHKSNVTKIFSMVDYFDGKMPSIEALFPNEIIHNTLGEMISLRGKKQLRISETEKYAHVTFFFNCGAETPYNNEDRILIPSPKVATYDLKPEMSAYEITETLTEKIRTNEYDFICVNFANADMVGHTGNFEAAKKACEVLDDCLKIVKSAAIENDYIMLITADHGNIEQMFDEESNQPHTAHTLNKVPFICVNENIKMIANVGEEYGLRDVAPTVLHLMGLEIPTEMTGKPLFTSD
jgi:2,3-bisphosphoglycerate-independent phosphoglycerate mutase